MGAAAKGCGAPREWSAPPERVILTKRFEMKLNLFNYLKRKFPQLVIINLQILKFQLDLNIQEDLGKVCYQCARQQGQSLHKEMGYFNQITIFFYYIFPIAELYGPTGSILMPEYLKLQMNLKKNLNSSQCGDPLLRVPDPRDWGTPRVIFPTGYKGTL
ncbi:hypothetical protein VP01_3625g2 [Puccinia sorghi]|uniref:Uncharacterized protein n=1 Tax=Puccinia sorghi TaxID=27349 RepID=A0A0L6UUX1_9BASI|nr:hypothetical protein VP01_3625g2 [Puccinia sorghi]